MEISGRFLKDGDKEDPFCRYGNLVQYEVTQGFLAIRLRREIVKVSMVAEQEELDLAGADHHGQAPELGEVRKNWIVLGSRHALLEKDSAPRMGITGSKDEIAAIEIAPLRLVPVVVKTRPL
jgi:hypothetical protein